MVEPCDQLNINIPVPRGGTPATLSVLRSSDGRITIECKHPFVSNRFRWTSRSEEDESLYLAPSPEVKFPDESSVWDLLQETFKKWETEVFPYSDYVDYSKPNVLQADDSNLLLNIELLPEYPHIFATFDMVMTGSSGTMKPVVKHNKIVLKRPLDNPVFSEDGPTLSPKVIVTCCKDPISEEVTVSCSHPNYPKGFQWKSGYGRTFSSSVFQDPSAVWKCLMAEAAKDLEAGNSDFADSLGE